MKKILLTILTISIFSSVSAQNLLDDKYYFVSGNELFGIKRSNDTIYEFKCNADFRCSERYRKQFKILKSKNVGNREILAIERIDSISLTL